MNKSKTIIIYFPKEYKTKYNPKKEIYWFDSEEKVKVFPKKVDMSLEE